MKRDLVFVKIKNKKWLTYLWFKTLMWLLKRNSKLPSNNSYTRKEVTIAHLVDLFTLPKQPFYHEVINPAQG